MTTLIRKLAVARAARRARRAELVHAVWQDRRRRPYREPRLACS